MRISDRFCETGRQVGVPPQWESRRWFARTACLFVSLGVVLAGAASRAGEVVVSSQHATQQPAAQHAVRVADPSPASLTGSASSTASRVVQCTYSTGKSGHRLKWQRVQRADGSEVAGGGSGAEPAQFTEPIGPPAPLTVPVDPFDDPFGDSKQGNVAGSQPGQTTPGVGRAGSVPPPLVPAEDAARTFSQEAAGPSQTDSAAGAFEQQQGIGQRALEEALAAGPSVVAEACPAPGTLEHPLLAGLTPIDELGYRITTGPGRLPDDCPISKQTVSPPPTRGWPQLTFTWKASALCHKPAYFEQVHLERYGHSLGPYLQPVVSGAHFFLTIPVLPYKMGLYPPNECLYTLGYYRPGSCAPYMLDPLPISLRAALYQAGATVGGVFVLP